MPKPRRLNRRAFLGKAAGAGAALSAAGASADEDDPRAGKGSGSSGPSGPARAAAPGAAADADAAALPARDPADLHRAVAAAIAGKHLGRPVFVRYTVQSADVGASAIDRAARTAGVVAGWIGEPIDRIFAVGSARDGCIALTLEFPGPATAAVCLVRSRPRGAGIDLMIVGNHGAAYFDSGAAEPWDQAPAPPAEPAPAALSAAIEKSLTAGKPVRL
jgi:hypothetical protein